MSLVSTRTCIGCRKRAPTSDLVRLVLVEGRVTAGARAVRPGRGASIHPREACVVAAARTHAFARAFRTAVVPVAASSEVDNALWTLTREIQTAHVMQQPRAGRTP